MTSYTVKPNRKRIMPAPQIECPHCKGKGRIALTGVYAETLQGLKRRTRAGNDTVANRDAEWFSCEATALSNRLRWLEAHGLAKSKRYGRQRRYEAIL